MKSKEFLSEIRAMSLTELKEKARSLSEENMKLRFKRGSGQLEGGHLLSQVRRNLARVMTLITEKERQEAA